MTVVSSTHHYLEIALVREAREYRKKEEKNGGFHHPSRVRNPFLLLQLELKGFMDLLPCLHPLPTSRCLPAWSPGWGILEEKMGKFTTDLVMSYSLLSQSECCHFTFQSSHIAASYVLSRYCSYLQ